MDNELDSWGWLLIVAAIVCLAALFRSIDFDTKHPLTAEQLYERRIDAWLSLPGWIVGPIPQRDDPNPGGPQRGMFPY